MSTEQQREENDADLDTFEHDLIAALEAEEGRELEELQQPNGGDDDDDEDDVVLADGGGDDDEEETGGRKKKKAKKKTPTLKKPVAVAAAKKGSRGKKTAEGDTAPPKAPSLPPLPKMPTSGPDAAVLETDLAQNRRWLKDLVAHAEEALLSNESLAEVRANRVVSAYAKVLREAVLAVGNLEKRYEEAHRVFVAYSFEARRTETYGDRRGPAAYASMGK